MAERTDLYGAASCQFTAELRDELEWKGCEFNEYDVESDGTALARMQELTRGGRTVPVLVEDGRVVQIGVNGRGCMVSGGTKAADDS